VIGNDANNDIFGGGGNDDLRGGAGIDHIEGQAGDDVIRSDGDGGLYTGGTGNDFMFSGLGDETMRGGGGNDTIDHTIYNGTYVFDMVTGNTNFAGESYLGFENVNMGNGNDTVSGTGGANVINGGGGNDTLDGRGGNDTINGQEGNDVIVGGTGRDLMDGNLGADRFLFNSTAESLAGANRDTVANFMWSEGDKVDLSPIDADLTVAGNQAFELAQLTFDGATEILTANVIGGADLQIHMDNVQPGFAVSLDVIA
jgi:Ca2+-binding RTX toxin-like protein